MEQDTAVTVQKKLAVEGCRVSSTSPKKMVINVCDQPGEDGKGYQESRPFSCGEEQLR